MFHLSSITIYTMTCISFYCRSSGYYWQKGPADASWHRDGLCGDETVIRVCFQ